MTVWDVGISLSIDWSHRDVRFNESTMSVRLRANRLNRVPSSWIVCPFRTLPHRFRRVQAGNCFGDPVIATANRRVADFLIAKRREHRVAGLGGKPRARDRGREPDSRYRASVGRTRRFDCLTEDIRQVADFGPVGTGGIVHVDGTRMERDLEQAARLTVLADQRSP